MLRIEQTVGPAVVCSRDCEGIQMLRLRVLARALLLLTPALLAQEIPAGTVMPVMLQSTLNAKKARIGQTIQARVMQDVPLSSETRIRAGTKLVGHIVEVTRPSTTSGSRIVLTFDRLMIQGASVPVTTSLRSLASMMDVFDAQLPTTAIDDRGTSQSDWVTTQIGGDAVYRGAGIVMSHGEVVGKSTDSGEVTAKPDCVSRRWLPRSHGRKRASAGTLVVLTFGLWRLRLRRPENIPCRQK